MIKRTTGFWIGYGPSAGIAEGPLYWFIHFFLCNIYFIFHINEVELVRVSQLNVFLTMITLQM